MLYVLGVGILAFGVVLNIKTNYGVSPVNAVPYSISKISGLELGNTTILCYLGYIVVEIFIMIRNKDLKYNVLLQLPFGIMFGKFTTLFNSFLSFQLTNHVQRLLVLFLAVFFTALGVVITINMKIVPIPPDGLTYEISKLIKKDLGTAKILFDIFSVIVTLIVSMVFAGKLIGIGIGTLFCALFIGKTVKVLNLSKCVREVEIISN